MLRTALGFLTKNWQTTLFLLSIGTVVSSMLALKIQRDRAIRERNEMAIAFVNERARSSSLEQIADTLAARLALQRELKLDAMAEAARLDELAASTSIAVRVDTVTVEGEAPINNSGFAEIENYTEPFTVRGQLEFTGEVFNYSIGIELDPIFMRAVIGCRPSAPGELADEAVLALHTPRWMTVDSLETVIDPGICNQTLVQVRNGSGVSDWWFPLIGAAAGAVTAAVFNEPLWQGAALGGSVGFFFTIHF